MGSKPFCYLRGIRLFHDHVGLTAFTDVSLLKDFLKLRYMHHIIFLLLICKYLWTFSKQVALKMSNKSVNLKSHFFFRCKCALFQYLNDQKDICRRVCDGENGRTGHGGYGDVGGVRFK